MVRSLIIVSVCAQVMLLLSACLGAGAVVLMQLQEEGLAEGS